MKNIVFDYKPETQSRRRLHGKTARKKKYKKEKNPRNTSAPPVFSLALLSISISVNPSIHCLRIIHHFYLEHTSRAEQEKK